MKRPRELAARLEWDWLGANDAIEGRQPIQLDNTRKRAFIERWKGTQVATFRDLEIRTSSPISQESYRYVEQLASHHEADAVRGHAWTQLAVALRDQDHVMLCECAWTASFPSVIHNQRIALDDLLHRVPQTEPSLLLGLVGELNTLNLLHLAGVPVVRVQGNLYGNYPIEFTAIGVKFGAALLDD